VDVLEDGGCVDTASNWEGLAVRAERPFDRRRILLIVVLPLVLERVGNGERVVECHHDPVVKKVLLLSMAFQEAKSVVQPSRQMAE
jgi:hypothetical protein